MLNKLGPFSVPNGTCGPVDRSKSGFRGCEMFFLLLSPASRFLRSSLHAADYFIDILNTDIFRKHSASDSPGSVFQILLYFLWLAGEDVADFLYGCRRGENKGELAQHLAPNGILPEKIKRLI